MQVCGGDIGENPEFMTEIHLFSYVILRQKAAHCKISEPLSMQQYYLMNSWHQE